jgi:hypothetical protein
MTTLSILEGRRVLLAPPFGNPEETHYMVLPLEVAKARWGWQIDVLCTEKDRAAYADFGTPGGKLYIRPDMLEVASWEADADAVADVEQRLWEAQSIAGWPAGQVTLAADSTIGRAFISPALELTEARIGSRVLADNTEPSRVVRRLFRFADELLEASAPDLVFSYEWAKPWLATLWLAATRRGIPCAAVRPSKIRSDHFYVTTDRRLFNTLARSRAAAKHNSSEPISPEARAYIREFRERPRMVKYIEAQFQAAGARNWLLWHARYARTVMKEIGRSFRSRKNERRMFMAGPLIGYNRRLIKANRHRRFFQKLDESALTAMKYVYFPMHKETDLCLNFQASAWHDQRNSVRLVASMLPSGYRLLVREHRFNYGARPTAYYRELSRLPNVTLVDAFDSQFKYIRNADLIVTDNGSAGWEGLLLGRRVITLSTTFYDGAGLSHQLQSPERLGAAILEALAKPPITDPVLYDQSLGRMVDAEFEATFPMHWENAEEDLKRLASTFITALRLDVATTSAVAPAEVGSQAERLNLVGERVECALGSGRQARQPSRASEPVLGLRPAEPATRGPVSR